MHSGLFADLPGFLNGRVSAQQRCIGSEASHEAWRRGAAAAPSELPLPGMTSLCLGLDGGLGISTHDDRMARLWEHGWPAHPRREDGGTACRRMHAPCRRLAAFQHKSKHVLTACDGAGAHAAVGDAAGVVHLYDLLDLDDGFCPFQGLSQTGGNPISSVAVLPPGPEV